MEEKDNQIQNADIVTNVPYEPISDICASLETVVPASMRFELHKAMETVDRRVNDVDEYVARKLGYITGKANEEERRAGLTLLCDAFGAEQVDGIATAIYNIEYKNQGIIIADQTGIGKGRQAAGVIRYAIREGLQPIFLTEKPNLFSDILRDLIDIGSDDGIVLKYLEGSQEVDATEVDDEDDDDQKELEELGEEMEGTEDDETEVNSNFRKRAIYRKNQQYEMQSKGKKKINPFIINADGVKTKVKDEVGNIIYEPNNAVIKKAFQTGVVPPQYKCVFATYSQFRGNPKNPSVKMNFLRQIARNNIVILDESHNASGSSQTGEFLLSVLQETKGVVFLSATFAKRPDNMPIYATKTAIADANMTTDALVAAVESGGVALQEILSSQLVGEAQMIRRQRSFEGIETNYIYLDKSQDAGSRPFLNKEMEHRAIYDRATEIIRDIIYFQKEYVDPVIKDADTEAAATQTTVSVGKGVAEAGINNAPAFSGVFNVINQLLFSLKAESVAKVAIERLKQKKSVVIAFGNTMESFLDDLENEKGERVQYGDLVNCDFQMVLMRRLKGALRYTEKKAGQKNPEVKYLDPQAQGHQFYNEYKRIQEMIREASIGINVSPIDVVVSILEKAGYKCVEVTGRSSRLQIIDDNKAKLVRRDKVSATDAFRMFNDNEYDVLLINRSGSTGASAQAKATNKVPPNKVKQRCMIILQAELDINTEVQKRGRINRTGQLLKPIYDYVISAVPAEQRLMMMLQKKLKSLDANTTSNQKDSKEMLDTPDFLNKYGDEIAVEYLKENPEINLMIDDPLRMIDDDGKTDDKKINTANAAHRISGRIGILPIEYQEDFYNELITRYESTIDLLNQTDENDLEVKDMDLDAETIERQVVVSGKPNAESVFGNDTILEKCRVNNLRKPFSSKELSLLIEKELSGSNAETIKQQNIDNLRTFLTDHAKEEVQETEQLYANMLEKIKNEKGYKSLKDEDEKADYIEDRTNEINEAKDKSVKRIKDTANNRFQMVRALFDFFYIGRVIGYPSITYKTDATWYKGVVIGFEIKKDATNPYVPSKMKLKIAIANGLKSVSIPLSKVDITDAIQKITYQNINRYEDETIFEVWDDLVRESTGDKEIRYIVTGNILQGLGKSELRGKLISYTTAEGKIKKGVLLPFGFDPNMGKSGGIKVTIPIIKALPLIKALGNDQMISTNDNMSFVKRWDGNYSIIVPSQKKVGGKYYLDDVILGIVYRGDFNKSGSNMIALVPEDKIDNLVEYLQNKFNVSVLVSRTQFRLSGIEMNVKEDNVTEPVVSGLSKARSEYEQEAGMEDVEDEQTAYLVQAKALAEKRAGLNNLYRKLTLAAIRQGASASQF